MNVKLFFEAIIKFLLGILLVGALIFVPAGTLNFFNGWLFMGALFMPMFLAGIVMMIKNPKLLKSRLNAKEKQKAQGYVINLSGIMFIVGFVLAGLDFRYNWFNIPQLVSFIAFGVMILSYILFAVVLAQNTYLSRTIKVEQGQKVIQTGVYSIVRHPMYTATIFLFLSMPLVLGSLISFFVFLFYPILIGIRVVNEEKFLEKELEGYTEYKNKVRYRIIPFIW